MNNVQETENQGFSRFTVSPEDCGLIFRLVDQLSTYKAGQHEQDEVVPPDEEGVSF